MDPKSWTGGIHKTKPEKERSEVDDAALASPAWHEEELRRTEAAFAAGKVEVLDWQEAKAELRKRFE